MFRTVVLPTSLLVGTIIGAGVFALPFVFEQAGILTGLFYLIIFGLVFTLIHLMYAEVILKTEPPPAAGREQGEGNHRFPGYARIYLGNAGFLISVLTTIVGMFFILTVYLILSVSFINLIRPAGLGISDASNLLIFWLFGSAAIFLGIRRIAFSEFLITGSIVAIILIIFGYGLNHFDRTISAQFFNSKNLFLPYGVILFSLAGRVAIPAIINYFQKIGQPLVRIKKPIILGTLLPSLVYLLFIFGILSLSGIVSEDAVSGLVGRLPNLILILIGVFGLISLWSSYIVIGLDVKAALNLDLKLPKILAGLTVIILPLFLYFCGLQNFLVLVGLIGGIFIALEGIFIVLMWRNVRKIKPQRVLLKKLNPLLLYVLIMVFIGGIIYEIIR